MSKNSIGRINIQSLQQAGQRRGEKLPPGARGLPGPKARGNEGTMPSGKTTRAPFMKGKTFLVEEVGDVKLE